MVHTVDTLDVLDSGLHCSLIPRGTRNIGYRVVLDCITGSLPVPTMHGCLLWTYADIQKVTYLLGYILRFHLIVCDAVCNSSVVTQTLQGS